MKKYFVFFLIILSVTLIGFIVLKSDINSIKNDFKTSIYKIKTGFGYSISYNNKLLIKQENIPAIQNNQPFCSFNDAQKVSDLVKEKLEKKETPKISLIELKKLKIQLNCPN
ncbi:DUF4907 domain-containing protein [Flavivirga aquimarina]|uniref:DUF4907 domain-containing protein n=1 Tax=Flavivirga aquimarina TaxID=2027862 RepID=A0ABT8W8F9_9FLAO|nr:DUF4907 domain-containing protein [Flavivirga aquimarina]MDO5969418.1 DUF4907 domain-containing protein [Flavivirga aquimarina]